jgi:hypothetical protein
VTEREREREREKERDFIDNHEVTEGREGGREGGRERFTRNFP